MKKIFNAEQSKKIDKETIERKNIESIDLMERAAFALFTELIKTLKKDRLTLIFAGAGNNGGDALAVARMLLEANYKIKVYLVDTKNKLSKDCLINKERFEKLESLSIIRQNEDIPTIENEEIAIIEGLFGVGLNRPIEGVFLELIQRINHSSAFVYSIDMPSGLFVEDNTNNSTEGIIRADCVLTLQYPKLALLLPENGLYCNKLVVLDIGLLKESLIEMDSDYYFIEKKDISEKIKDRSTFSHKGTYGHALLIAGSYGKMGAAVLASRACLRAGVGLLTVHVPKMGVDVLQSTVPEAMVSIDSNKSFSTNLGDIDIQKMTLGVGPGLGQESETNLFLEKLLESGKPMVIDADALNLISKDDSLKRKIPRDSILTPHPVEFDRLIGKKSENGYLRLQYGRAFAKKYHVYIVLKGAFSALILPDGSVFFNTTGNPGMSTGGSGDILTGIITSLLAQKYTSLNAMLIGTYIHGLAADLAIIEKTEQALLPSDIIDYLGKAYFALKS